jgi:hypothetical protein
MKPIFSTQLFFSFLGLTSLTNIHHAPRRTQGADMYLPRDRREQRKPGGRESCRGSEEDPAGAVVEKSDAGAAAGRISSARLFSCDCY